MTGRHRSAGSAQPDSPIADILGLARYNWAREESDYFHCLREEPGNTVMIEETHIFPAMKRVRDWAGEAAATAGGKETAMPAVQGYLSASLQDMTEVFGEPVKSAERSPESHLRWLLDGGTVLHDLKADGVKPEQQHTWHIAGWSPAAVDQVIGIAVRARRRVSVTEPAGRRDRVTVRIPPAPGTADG